MRILACLPLVAALCGAFLTSIYPSPVWAEPTESCDLSFNYHVNYRNNLLELTGDDSQQYRFSAQGVWLDGQRLALNPQQLALAEEYRQAVIKQLPEVIALVDDTMTVVNQALLASLGPLLGQAQQQQLSDILQQTKLKVARQVGRDNDGFHLNATEYAFSDVFDAEFEQQIAELATQSIASFMLQMGMDMLSNNTSDADNSIDKFSTRMTQMGSQIEQAVNDSSEQLERRATGVCHTLRSLEQLEQQLTTAIPALAKMDLVNTAD
ncbi:hypothetical protein NFHSH190041_27380 [Shewanella sp. NFH-SH190041]|uniref:YggN family protein n=1 Tax=Shewanella sp. NFH-SH190041 TaxID=2950245 RepID=UPI0021C45362|nr:YggN family protein [Shewanella sp. NFH-SH190041]BDM65286.1 hypothetical protein NFHSH190041_27380 [Shewanella sp. NFH-SH190041]